MLKTPTTFFMISDGGRKKKIHLPKYIPLCCRIATKWAVQKFIGGICIGSLEERTAMFKIVLLT